MSAKLAAGSRLNPTRYFCSRSFLKLNVSFRGGKSSDAPTNLLGLKLATTLAIPLCVRVLSASQRGLFLLPSVQLRSVPSATPVGRPSYATPGVEKYIIRVQILDVSVHRS